MRKLVPAAILLASFLDGHGVAAAAPSCLIQTMARYHEGKSAFQNGMHDLISQRAPRLASLAKASRDLQIALWERRRRQFGYLAHTAPNRLITDQGVSELVNFEWTEADQKEWLRSDPGAGKLAARIKALEGPVQDHPDWPELRTLVQSTLSQSAEFKNLMAELDEVQQETGSLLKACT